ncbi:MAG: patatin-like phospholipase family protein [Wenzhouxiangellaceae bacterium]|nr:patatin-like phospholipase family protein [Wenzhouxiangellaceae bacterium]
MNPSEAQSSSRADSGQATLSLVLGSGGARGLAHIGAIRALEQAGYRIQSIAGCSMGAVIGGMYAAGKLTDYSDWICSLQQSDVLKLVDWTLSGGGLIRGKKIIEQLREMVGDVEIENLDIDFTAVTVDIEQGREIWLSKGSLFDAIRASIAIPGLFTPHRYHGKLLVDGGILNPVPVAPTLRCLTDLTMVVNVNGPIPGSSSRISSRAEKHDSEGPGLAADQADDDAGLIDRIRKFFNGLVDHDDSAREDTPPGLVAILLKSLETMESVITRQHLAVFRPDLVIEVPKNACMIHEFHRAEELIELGYRRTIDALERACD